MLRKKESYEDTILAYQTPAYYSNNYLIYSSSYRPQALLALA